MDESIFLFRLEVEHELNLEQIWPDGDAPEHPTVEDVKAAVESCGGQHRVCEDWMLTDGLTLTIYGEGGSAEPWT